MSNPSQPDTDVEIDVRALFIAILKRLPILLILAGAVAGGTFILLGHVTPVYTSSATVLIVSGESDITRSQGGEAVAVDREAIASQVQLIRSRDLARAVAEKLDLAAYPEFNLLVDRTWIGRLLAVFGIVRETRGGTTEQRVLDAYYDRLSVYAVDESRVIAIEFSAEGAELAAAVANAIAEEYIALQRAAKRDLTVDAAQWLAVQIDGLRAQVQEAEARVERYRTENDLFAGVGVGGEATTLTQQQLSDLSAELTRMRATRSEAEARAAQIRSALDAGTVPNLSEVLSSALIQRLIEQQVALRAELAQLNATLLPQHPRMRELGAQVADLDRQIAAEARKILDAQEADARLAAARETEIERSLAALKVTAAGANDASVELRALEREAAAQRDLLESYLLRYREAVAREAADYIPADARVVSRAAVPFEPSFPRKVPMSIMAGVAALVLALALVLLRELGSGRSMRPVAVRPAVAGEPHAGSPRWSDDSSVRRMMSAAPSLVPEMPDRAEERIRDIASEIVVSGQKRILVTLAEGSDAGGRPLGAVALARALARSDARVCLVDFRGDGADAASMGEGDSLPGFADLFAGEASFAQVIFRDRRSRVHFIPTGGSLPQPGDFGAEQLETVLSALTLTYDFVVFDCADDLVGALAPSCGVAMVVSEFGADDPRTDAASARIADVSEAKMLLLVVDPAAGPSPAHHATANAGAAA